MKKMSRGFRVLLYLGAAVMVVVVAAGISSRNRLLPRVTGTKVARQDVVSKVTANGKVQAEKKVELSALVMGQIVNLAVRNGERVKKGDFLLQIDRNRAAAEEQGSHAALQGSLAARDSALSAVRQAEDEYDRAKKNFDARILPQAELDRARSARDMAVSNLEVAERRIEQNRASLAASRDTLSKTTVRSPIAGIVTALPIKEGEVTVIGTMNNPGTRLMTISDMSVVEAVLMVDETDVPRVAIGQNALLSAEAYPGEEFRGLVTQVESSPIERDDPDLQGLVSTSDAINFKVRVKMLRPPETIRPGFSVTADILTGSKSDVLVVPLAAVVARDSPGGGKTAAGRLKIESGVYVVRDGRAVFVPIVPGISDELETEVVQGLSGGEMIVTGPFKTLRTLKDGERVRLEVQEKGADKVATGLSRAR
ncbi:MAG: efflux RND transporter periplasmic adaptor subunit [Acidobacteria bacterium]|nr:efflux RND transporter periplasmic adaptor subunit [Acidobacteriota bacterium]MCA1609992.1 efflux RND transporter periplasmic adaptor subunit [Acidobacteriota bacterium]